MTIQSREPQVMILDDAFDEAIALFNTKLANPEKDSEATSVVEDIEKHWAEVRGVGGRKPSDGHIQYTVLGVLVAFYLLITTNRPVSEAGATRLLLNEITADQRRRVGMTGDLSGTRFDVIAAGLAPNATDEERKAGDRELQREHARLAKFWSEVVKGFDPSPFYKDAKMTNRERKAILADQNHARRRITKEVEEANLLKLHHIINKIVAASTKGATTDGWHGDIATDETIVLLSNGKAGHGVRDDLKLSIDPDAEYWQGKKGEGFEATGFGYGVTYAVRMPRPYGKQIPRVAIGINVARAQGGRAHHFRPAIESADLHGLTMENRERICAADHGYTDKDPWIPTLLELGYEPVSSFPRGWSRSKQLDDLTQDGKKTGGPELVCGRMLCPGAAGLGEQDLPQRGESDDQSEAAILDLTRKTDLIEAFAMPIRNQLRPAKSGKKGGRPRKDAPPPQLFNITVQCPAAAGKANCDNYQFINGTRLANVPDIPNPPHRNPKEAHLRPQACRQDFTTYQLDKTEIKWLQKYTWESHFWADLYETFRSANERFHSQLKTPSSGGVTERGWIQVRGVAKFSILISMATAVTNRNLIRKFIIEGGAYEPSPAELRRRRRERIFARQNSKAA